MEREKYLQMNVIIFACVTMLALSTLTQSAEFSSFTFTWEPSDAVVAPGSSVTIHCTVRSDSTPIIEWLRNGIPVPLSNQRFTKFSNGSLTIRSLRGEPSVSGRYSCQVEDQASTILLISRKAVVSIARLELASDPADVSDVYTGDTARFECPAEGQGPLEFVWQKGDPWRDIDLTGEVNSRVNLLPSGTLEIQDVRLSDGGSYRCIVTSPYNLREFSRGADLRVRRGPPSSSRPFEFTKALEPSIQRTAGSPVILEVSTSQPATFRWYKNDAELSLPGDHYTLVGQGSLYIEELQEIHTAIYRVVAEAMDGSQIESSTSVLTLVPPSFTVNPVNKAAREGDIVVLPCRTYGIPNPTVVWLKDGDPIRIENAFKIVQGNSLSIDSALIDDSGFYQCVATNDVGNIQGSMELLVLGPGPPSGPVPSMPDKTSVSMVSARTAFVNWDPPRTTNGEIIQYRISLKAENDPSVRTRIISVKGDTSKLIADLRPGTEYSLQILARNNNGLGESSDSITFITREAVQVPEQPQNLEATVQSSSSVLVRWEPPIDTFGDLLGYRLFYAAQDGLASREEKILVTGTSKVVGGLEPYTVYGFRVLAVNENGRGASTGDVQVETFTAKPGTPPANFSAESTSNSSITLWWNPPWTQQNGPITEYRIKYRLLDEEYYKAEIKVAGSINSYIFSKQERNRIYEFKIAAVTVNGTGPFTEDWLQEYTKKRQLGDTQLPTGDRVAGPPWWLWLIALALFVLILGLAFLLLLCALCRGFKCFSSMFPCCSDVCGPVGCFSQCYKSLDRCWASCSPCYCSDEEERAGTAISGGSDMLGSSKTEKEMDDLIKEDATSHQ